MFAGASKMKSKIDYIYTEYHEEEMYVGATNLQTIKDMLPGHELVSDWKYNDVLGGDALFKRRG